MSLGSNMAHLVSTFVSINNRDMKLIDFMEAFPKDKECYECKHCHYRQSLKANTVMYGSQLPLRYWFIAMHLLTSTKKSFSAALKLTNYGHTES